jgi:hypothetical protein
MPAQPATLSVPLDFLAVNGPARLLPGKLKIKKRCVGPTQKWPRKSQAGQPLANKLGRKAVAARGLDVKGVLFYSQKVGP